MTETGLEPKLSSTEDALVGEVPEPAGAPAVAAPPGRKQSFRRYVAYRVLAMLPILFLVHLFAFILIEFVPGDTARTVAGDNATDEQVEIIRADLGLDRPLPARFVDRTVDVLHGDLGESVIIAPGKSIASIIWEALPVTVSIGLAAIVFATMLGVPLGAVAALNRDGPIDHLLNAITSLSLALPPFVVGPLLIAVVSIQRGWLPSGGYQPLSAGFGTWSEYVVLPAVALGLAPAAEVARQVRGSTVSVMEQAYIRTADAKGLRRSRVVGRHALKNAAIPTITTLGLLVTRVLGGSVLVEGVFGINGIGTLTVAAVRQVDVTMVQGIVLVSGVIVLMTNLLVDISYVFFNPKLRR